MSLAPGNRKLEGLIEDNWSDAPPFAVAILEPWRESLESSASDFDESSCSWRDFRMALWGCVPDAVMDAVSRAMLSTTVTVPAGDPINPAHYKSHPSGVECITVVEHMSLNAGTAIKYIWRAGLRTKDPIEDLKKARWHVDREIGRLEKLAGQ